MPERCNSLKTKIIKCFDRVNPNDKNNHLYKCKIDNCGRVLLGKQHTDLTAHIKNKHTDFFESNIRRSVIDPTEFAKKRLKFIQDLAEIIAIDGRSFKHLAGSGFKSLIADKLAVLIETGYDKGLTSPVYPAVRAHIKYQAREVMNRIKSEVNSKFVALMVDTASKNNKSFMGLSLQFVLDGLVVVRNIGIIELLDAHSSRNLMNTIMNRLNFLEIDRKQIIAITTDNAPNMSAMVKRFNVFEDEEDNEIENSETTSEGENSDFDNDDDASLMEIGDQESEAELDDLLDDNSETVSLIEKCLSNYALETLDINGIKCAAHTLQLAVRGTLKNSKHQSLINEFRNVCKFLRKPTNIRIMKEENIRIWIPRLDCETRWSSLYRMVCINNDESNNTNVHSIFLFFFLLLVG